MSYSTGDADIARYKASITSEKNVSIDFVVNEATGIYVLSKSVPTDESSREKFLLEMSRVHPQFSTSYPIVLKYIVMLGSYSPKVFKLWLKKIAMSPWKTEEEYIEAQVIYISNLFRHFNPKANTNVVNDHRNGIRKMLMNEHKTFKEYANKFTEKVTADEEEFRKRNKEELLKYLAAAPAEELARAGTVRTESECVTVFANTATHAIDTQPHTCSLSINSGDLLD